jgi:membrane-associated protein
VIAVLPLLALLVLLDGPFPIVPSEPLLMTATAVAAGRHESLLVTGLFLAAFTGSVLGDQLLFGLGRTSRRLREPGDSGAARWVRRNIAARPAVTIIGARFLPGGRLLSTVAAGRFGLPRARFTTWSLASSAAWSAYMMGIGVLLGPLTGGDPVRGLLAGLAMAALTGGTFTLVQGIRRHLLGGRGVAVAHGGSGPCPHDPGPTHAAALAGAMGCDR